jgi:multidrug resistance efflux pump
MTRLTFSKNLTGFAGAFVPAIQPLSDLVRERDFWVDGVSYST